MGKLLGLPMGVRRLLHQPRRRRPELGRQPARPARWPRRAAITSWACPCADDVMLNYQSTSYHDAAAVRELLRACDRRRSLPPGSKNSAFCAMAASAHESAASRRVLEAAHGVLAAQ